MNDDYKESLNPQKGFIWRIVHIKNLPWIFDNGLHCGNSPIKAEKWHSIGNAELIRKRAERPVPAGPKGFLNDYVPFYFTPFSPMLLNIHTGRGVQKQPMEDIVFLVSTVYKIKEHPLQYVFTDCHAYCEWAKFYTDLKDLNQIDWPIIQQRNFSRDPNNIGKTERYQAEFLVHQSCPISAIMGIICYSDTIKERIENLVNSHGVSLRVLSRRRWYFYNDQLRTR